MSGDVDWRPTASHEVLMRRAALLAATRSFFAERGVMEVTTPALYPACAQDPGIAIVETRLPGIGDRRLFLQPSPEAAMKRLLAAGSGAIYQIGPAFRAGEVGRLHNPEFTMLEWYRPGFTLEALMAEVDALLAVLLGAAPGRRTSYRAAFLDAVGLDPFTAPHDGLLSAALAAGLHATAGVDRDLLLDLLFSHRVEPTLGPGTVHVRDFPASQAAMARVAGPVCRRVEVYVDGVELANGYQELTDPREQRARLEASARQRARRGMPDLPIDEPFLAALEHGLPESCGIALGFDRLVMLAEGLTDIAEVLTFPLRGPPGSPT